MLLALNTGVTQSKPQNPDFCDWIFTQRIITLRCYSPYILLLSGMIISGCPCQKASVYSNCLSTFRLRGTSSRIEASHLRRQSQCFGHKDSCSGTTLDTNDPLKFESSAWLGISIRWSGSSCSRVLIQSLGSSCWTSSCRPDFQCRSRVGASACECSRIGCVYQQFHHP